MKSIKLRRKIYGVSLLISLSTNFLPAYSQSPTTDQNSAPTVTKPLQGNVSRMQHLERPKAQDGAPLEDILKAFPSLDNTAPLKGQAQAGPVKTSPVLTGATTVNAPAKLYRGWLEDTHPQFSLKTSTMASNRLLVVTDKYDQAERTLSSLALPFTTVDKKKFASCDLSSAQVIVIDCGPQNLSVPALVKLRDFVHRGGYLFTTDWMIDRIDQVIFPGYVAWNGANNQQAMYDAALVGQQSVLFRRAVTNAFWKMDKHCHLIRVINKEAVQVLARSSSLAKDDPDGQGILAVVFAVGKGYVMHMTAHFDRSQAPGGFDLPDPAPVIGISLRQALAINFVVAGLEGTRLQAEK